MATNLLRALLQEEEDDDDGDYASLLAIAALEEEQHANGQSSHRCGSIPGHAVIQRYRVQRHERLYHDYFSESPVYPEHLFRTRFRMHRLLFLRILSTVEAYDSYFVQRQNDNGTIGLSSLQKMTATMRMLAYGVSADFVYDYVRIGESTAIKSLKMFTKVVVAIFGDEYLRSPNNEDTTRLFAISNQRGFLRMLGSIDCMHWKWKNCPTTWHGMYTGHIRKLTIILEAIASCDLWIWHAFFGLPGALNDKYVLERSSVFAQLAEGRASAVNYLINGHKYTMGYYLANGIYTSWSTFVKTIPLPQGNKRKYFAAAQESARKDVEQAFGVLPARFAIVHGPACSWDETTLKNIMHACIIMHNMIIENEQDDDHIDLNYDVTNDTPTILVSHENTPELHIFIQNHHPIRDRQTHSQLYLDLVEHLCQQHGGI